MTWRKQKLGNETLKTGIYEVVLINKNLKQVQQIRGIWHAEGVAVKFYRNLLVAWVTSKILESYCKIYLQ